MPAFIETIPLRAQLPILGYRAFLPPAVYYCYYHHAYDLRNQVSIYRFLQWLHFHLTFNLSCPQACTLPLICAVAHMVIQVCSSKDGASLELHWGSPVAMAVVKQR